MLHFSKTLCITIGLSLTAASAIAAPVTPSQPAQPDILTPQLVGQGDYVCKGRLFKKWAQLWLKGNTPVQYKWSNNAPHKAELKGSTIYIDANPTATISNVVMGKDTKGNKIVKGDFKFKSNTKKGLVFTCKPA